MIYVIQRNGGCEGYSGAIVACQTENEARNLKAVMENGGAELLSIFAVPVWPEPVEVAWWNLKPIA